ncbi:MAG: 30S ribosomal protein S6 [Waddliaceae bacterium]|nr:30S ribosomal protein S6 [Waddliaceae bacterium]
MSTDEQKNLYEGMYVISSRLSDEARGHALEKVLDGIKSRNGEIVKMIEMGRRKLAYEISGHREGYYFLVYFEVAPSAIAEMWNEYHLHEDLVRFMTLRAESVLENLEFKALAEA